MSHEPPQQPSDPSTHVVTQQIEYVGELRCQAVHDPSKSELATDAPKDNQGLGQSFSPTDLLCTSLATCALTTMAIAARRDGYELGRCTVRVEKRMSTSPRRVGRIDLHYKLPGDLTEDQFTRLQRAAGHCPVHKSLSPEVEVVNHYEEDAPKSPAHLDAPAPPPKLPDPNLGR
jgi:putative redox protein